MIDICRMNCGTDCRKASRILDLLASFLMAATRWLLSISEVSISANPIKSRKFLQTQNSFGIPRIYILTPTNISSLGYLKIINIWDLKNLKPSRSLKGNSIHNSSFLDRVTMSEFQDFRSKNVAKALFGLRNGQLLNFIRISEELGHVIFSLNFSVTLESILLNLVFLTWWVAEAESTKRGLAGLAFGASASHLSCDR